MVRCGYGKGYYAAAMGVLFLLVATAVSFWAFSDADTEANKSAGAAIAGAAAAAIGVPNDASQDPAALYKPNVGAFNDDSQKEAPQDGASAPDEGAGNSYQSL